MAKKTKSLTFRLIVFASVFSVIVIVATIIGCRIFIERSFRKTVDPMLMQLVENVRISFLSDVNKEMALSEKMVLSPVVRKYMKDPSDPEWHDIGLAELSAYEQSFASKLSFWISDADKHYFANCEDKYVLDVNEPTSEWYRPSLNAPGNYSFYVDYEKSLQATFLWVNGIVRDDDGTPLGLAGTGIPLTEFINGLYKDFDSRLTMYMYNGLMETTAATSQDILDARTPIQELLPNANIPTEFPTETTIISASDGEYVLCPMPSVGWSIVIFCPKTEKSFYDNAVDTLGALAIFISIVIVVAFSIFILGIIKRIKMVLGELHNSVEQIENGDADLRKRITVHSQDELGDLTDEFNRFTETLRTIVSDIQNSENALSTAGSGLNDIMKENAAAVSEIMQDIDNTTNQIDMQTQSVGQTATSISEISQQISSLDSMVSNQVAGVKNASRSVQEMLGNIGNVNTSVNQMVTTFDDLWQNAKTGATKQSSANETIRKISEESQMLQEANKTISDIADQTNLLAMNAAIEAAHAGEAGKGFSVVADEIRKLSETSAEQSKTIGEQLKRIEDSITEVVVTSQESLESFNLVSTKISETSEVVNEIKVSMKGQLESSQQIGNILSGINASSTDLQKASKAMSENATAIHGEAEQLQSVTKNILNSIGTISVGANKISESSTSLTKISNNVSESISRMSDNIGKFRA